MSKHLFTTFVFTPAGASDAALAIAASRAGAVGVVIAVLYLRITFSDGVKASI